MTKLDTCGSVADHSRADKLQSTDTILDRRIKRISQKNRRLTALDIHQELLQGNVKIYQSVWKKTCIDISYIKKIRKNRHSFAREHLL